MAWTFEKIAGPFEGPTGGLAWDGSGMLFSAVAEGRILRYDPASQAWATFDLPTRGSEARYISVTEHTGALQVVVPYSRTSKVAVMSFRSEADMAALKAQAGK